MSNNKIIMYPILRKKSGKIDINEVSETELEGIVDHFFVQFIEQLKIHGVPQGPDFASDFYFAEQFMKATIFRAVGIHHPYQDNIDNMIEAARIEALGDEN